MAVYDDELLAAARVLIHRPKGRRGRLPSARVRRSISTTYYALFHFLLDEVGKRVVGVENAMRFRRRALARLISHTGARSALNKLRGSHADESIADFLRSGTASGPLAVPQFVRDMAQAFIDAHTKREDADYNLNKALSETDAILLHDRVKLAIRTWRGARTDSDRDLKNAVCLLILFKGQLRSTS